MAGFIGWIKALTIGKKIGLGVATLFTASAVTAPITTPPNTEENKTQGQVQEVEVKPETKIVTETESIAFTSSEQNDSSIASGQITIAVAGVNGERTKRYEVTAVNGRETSRKLISETVTKKPVNEIKKIGTKSTFKESAPRSDSCSGGYINVDGNCVQSPSSNPSGASAKCRDGTYSYSQNRRGTCSRHGGVSEWL
jgi:hypothetical protein